MNLQIINDEQIHSLLKKNEITLEELNSKVALLKEWLHQQPHLPHFMDDKTLKNYLWNNKCSLEKTKEKIDRFFTARKQLPEFFSNRDPTTEIYRKSHKAAYLFPLPKLTKDGCRVVIAKFSERDPSDYSFYEGCQTVINLSEILLLNENLASGQYIVLDGTNTQMAHIRKVIPSSLKKWAFYMQGIFPAQVKGVFAINIPNIAEYITMLIFPMMSKKIRERLFLFRGDHTELYKFIDREILPKEYGGDEESSEKLNDAWQETVESYKDWFLNEGMECANESKRPTKNRYKNAELFGLEGSFSKLEID